MQFSYCLLKFATVGCGQVLTVSVDLTKMSLEHINTCMGLVIWFIVTPVR